MTEKKDRNKETKAVIFNFKEQRCLEKNLQTLSLEESYSLSLINLNHKILKVQFKRLKDKVSKIKSHLTVDEIAEMKELEAKGQIPETFHSHNRGANLRIAAAEKRLKLMSSKKTSRKAKSAKPRISVENFASVDTPKTEISRKRSDSVCGAFIDAPPPDSTRSRKSVDFGLTKVLNIPTGDIKEPPDSETAISQDALKKRVSLASMLGLQSPSANTKEISTDISASTSSQGPNNKPSNQPHGPVRRPTLIDLMQGLARKVPEVSNKKKPDADKIRPMTVAVSAFKKKLSLADDLTKRPATSNPNSNKHRRNTKAEEEVMRLSKMIRDGVSKSPFSSHKAVEKEARDGKEKEKDPGFRSIRENALSKYDDDIDSNLGDDLYEERRKALMLSEMTTGLVLEDKLDFFFDNVEKYLKENPGEFIPFNKWRNMGEADDEDEKEEKEEKIEPPPPRKPKRSTLRRRELEKALTRTEEEVRMKNAEVWKDIDHCRYLRVPDELIDLSGIVTLAKDQMKLFDLMRVTDDDYE